MNRKLFFIAFLLVSLSLDGYSQKPQPTLEKNLRAHVEQLASPSLEGRRTGERGATQASAYIAKQFAQAKLKHGYVVGGQKPSYLQPFPYVAGVTLGPGNQLRIVPADSIRENKMDAGINWMPLGYSPNADIVATPIVFAGYGVAAPEANYDDYRYLDVRDKVVLMFDSTPDPGNPHSPFVRFNIHTKASIAKDKGAKAIILIAADNHFKADRLSRLVYERSLGETAVPVVGIARSVASELLGAADDKGLTAIEVYASNKAKPPTGPEAETWKAPSSLSVDAKATIKIDLTKKNADAYNVIGILEGTDPELRREAIIIGAHYDHLGRGGSGSLAANSTDIHHGADDNASGTSAVLELAREFARTKKNKRTLIFMAFSGEEEGLLGSKFYVNNPMWPLEKTIAMINLDMVGRLNDNKLTVGGIGTASEWNEAVKRRNEIMFDTDSGYGVGQKFTLQLNEDGFGPSDHSSFYGKQIPVLFFFTGTHVDYHKPSDTFEKINYEGLTRITNYVGEIVKSVDQNLLKPTYKVAQSSGQMGQVRLTVSLGTIPSYADSTDGMLLDGVRDNSPAAKAGLKAGDKVIKLAGKDVRNAMDYTYVLGSMKAGEEYEVVIKRGDETMTLKIIPAAPARR